jgi:hypothetical protein
MDSCPPKSVALWRPKRPLHAPIASVPCSSVLCRHRSHSSNGYFSHPDRMQVDDRENFGASSQHAQDWRRKLFSNDARRDEAIAEGVKQLAQHGAERSRHEWWAFEGFTHIDCCLITDRTVLFVEGKRTETVSPATRWFEKRSQLWRNVEAAQQFARGKQFSVILAVEQEGDGKVALQEADARLHDSYPHLMDTERTALSRCLLGFVTWPQVVQRFSLPANCLPSTVADVR